MIGRGKQLVLQNFDLIAEGSVQFLQPSAVLLKPAPGSFLQPFASLARLHQLLVHPVDVGDLLFELEESYPL